MDLTTQGLQNFRRLVWQWREIHIVPLSNCSVLYCSFTGVGVEAGPSPSSRLALKSDGLQQPSHTLDICVTFMPTAIRLFNSAAHSDSHLLRALILYSFPHCSHLWSVVGCFNSLTLFTLSGAPT